MAKNTRDFEQTVMTDEFHTQKVAYEEYDKALGHLVYRLEAVVQPNEAIKQLKDNPIMYPPGEDPLEKLSKALNNYSDVLGNMNSNSNAGHRGKLVQIADSSQKAADYRGPMQKKHREVICHMRKFHVVKFKSYQEKWAGFEAARDKMDLARHEVKQAKTTTEIEKRAVNYQESVEQFDTQCTAFIHALEELPSLQQLHGQDFKNWITTHRTYHYQMAGFF